MANDSWYESSPTAITVIPISKEQLLEQLPIFLPPSDKPLRIKVLSNTRVEIKDTYGNVVVSSRV